MTHSIMTLSITTFSIKTFSLMILSITTLKHNNKIKFDTQHNGACAVMLSVIILNAVWLSVANEPLMLKVIVSLLMLNVVM